MSTEIELKYLVYSTTPIESITSYLTQQQFSFEYQAFDLENCYFDTPDLALRQKDMGLRVRAKNGAIEQTMKTAGEVIGGLHKRPEYNVNITTKFPELILFPDKVCDEFESLSLIQSTLIPLFTTNFTRHCWTITAQDNSQVEMVFDQGFIESGDKQLVIAEIELELLSGNIDALFTIAQHLFVFMELRPGIESKAARGYAIFNGQSGNKTSESNSIIPLSVDLNYQQAFVKGIASGLKNLQQAIREYMLSPSLLTMAKIYEHLMLIRHGFWLFDDGLSEKAKHIRAELSHFVQLLSWIDNAIYLRELTQKKGNYSKKMSLNKQLVEQLNLAKRRFPTSDDMFKLIHSERFNVLQLSLLRILVIDAEIDQEKMIQQRSFDEFARFQLSQSLADLIEVMPDAITLSSEQYIAQSKLLNRSLLTGNWLGSLYDDENRQSYRAPWLDIKQGISELQTLWIIQQQLQNIEDKPKKLLDWQDSKVDGLLHALDHSRKMALSVVPYWLVQ